MNELVVMLLFVFSLDATKGTHSQVERIHGTRHCVDERRLILISETVHFVRVLLDFLAISLQLRVGLGTLTLQRRLVNFFTALSVNYLARALTTHLNALFVHEILYASSILDALRQGTLVV